MKNALLLFILMTLGLSGYSQNNPKIDSTKIWTIHGENTFLINQSSFSNWSAGGINSLAANLVLNYDFNYKKDKWSWDNKAIAAYGLSKQDGIGVRKNDDRLILNSLLGYQAAKYWMYTFYANFQTQFANGYNYSGTQPTLISKAFAPAYLTFGPGIAYKRSDNFRVNFSPAAVRIIMVEDNYLSSFGAFGVTPFKKSLFQFGASLDAYYKLNLMENISLENILKLYSDYLNKPQNIYTDYTANLFMKVNKFVTVNAGVELIYDDRTKILKEVDGVLGLHKALQVKQILGAGLTYKF
ncbi:MAG: DUF3078 domain-containing protein [Candidatus Pedobacter colombiensis]|uniref:DUF3078 domain-containing protein n=1 Tax=Candidatus Pedobacter colombiensis TaxID=3121371 RepID=A0AAJ6B6S5_9SPHI|nr:DUF3078 domain-containing protein [Pedobacter sp.]WEK18781.1 MAG: DUF3078 domain-containing protein [Pedobacter sp.]